MSEHLPDVDQLPSCGHCQRPIHPSDSRRHFGFYVAHGEGRCVQLLQMEIERQRERIAELERHLNKAEIERAWAIGMLKMAQEDAERWRAYLKCYDHEAMVGAEWDGPAAITSYIDHQRATSTTPATPEPTVEGALRELRERLGLPQEGKPT